MRVLGLALALLVVCLAACAAEPQDVVADDAATSDRGASVDRPAADAGTRFDVPTLDVPVFDVTTFDVTAVTDAPASDAGAACTPVGEVPYASHTSREEFTDPPSCDGCPRAFTNVGSLDVAMVAPGATTLRVEGVSAGAHQCEWYVLGGNCGVTHGVASVDPDGAGTFLTTVPVFCGTNVVQVVCRNDAGRRVLVRRIEGTQCAGAGRDLRVTLSWDATSRDMELHLLRARGRLNDPLDDCTWFTCMGAGGLDWGTPGDPSDNPTKDIDNVGALGPENVFLERAPAGTYHVVVEYWGSGLPSTSDVDVTVRERTVARVHRAGLPVHSVWYVGTVTFPAGTFARVDTLTPCDASWMARTRGCDLPLP